MSCVRCVFDDSSQCTIVLPEESVSLSRSLSFGYGLVHACTVPRLQVRFFGFALYEDRVGEVL